MPRPKKETTAIQPVQGKRKTFDESVDEEEESKAYQPTAGPSRGKRGLTNDEDATDSEDEDEEDDEAPEAVSAVNIHEGAVPDDEIALKQQSKRQAAAARSLRIAEAKAAQLAKEREKKAANKPNAPGTKQKRKAALPADTEEEGADAETVRLRKRMEAAMAAGDDESGESVGGASGDSEDEDDREDDGSESYGEIGDESGEDDEMASFHTVSEEGDADGSDEEDPDSDDSEILRDGPLSAKERQMRAQMQAMMEAAEARSGVASASGKSSKQAKGPTAAGDVGGAAPLKSALKGKGTSKQAASQAEQEAEDSFDLAPLSTYGRPLSAKVLKAAAAEEEAKRISAAESKAREKAREKERKRDKSKKRKLDEKETSRQIASGKHLKMLEPDLPTPGTGLPPVIDARRTAPAGAQSRATFYRTAMKNSGMVPGKRIMDGRRKLGNMGRTF